MEIADAPRPTPSLEALGKGATVWVAGSGDPLLVLHGWGLRPDVYTPSAMPLSMQGFQVAVPTMAVVGKRWCIDRAVHRAEKALDHLGWDRAIVVGNSLGGAIAISLAARNPDRVRLLGLVNSVGLQLDRGMLGWTLPWRRYATAANMRAVTAFGRNALSGRGLVNLAGAAWYARGCGLASELEAVRDAKIPSVLLWGEEDKLLPLDMGRQISRALGAPLRVVPGADHDWTIRHPELFARELEITLRTVLSEHELNGHGHGALGRLAGRLRGGKTRLGHPEARSRTRRAPS